MNTIKKITVSPHSSNYGDNDKNVAYLYRGYYVWQAGESGLFDAWNFASAVLHAPIAALGEAFDPYWDDDGDSESAPTRRDCLAAIDRRFSDAEPEVFRPDPEADRTITLTVSLDEAGTILAALDRRASGPEGPVAAAAKATYQSVDRQAYRQAVQ